MRRKTKKKLAIASITAFILAFGVGAYFIINKAPNEINNKKYSEKSEAPKPEPKKVQIVDENSKTRPYAVMINNLPLAQLVQSGLPKAYMVYELIAEGGITRYLALFKDVDVDKIGSVRSARHYYLDYALENDAIFVHWGWSPQAKEDISTLGINNINGLFYEGRYFYRDNPLNLPLEHTGFTDTEKLSQAVDALGYRKETNKGLLLNYSADPVNLDESIPANTVDLTYSRSSIRRYEYDEKSKLYNRFNGTEEQIDYPTGKQVTVKNIIVYQVNSYTIPGDSKGRQIVENIGSGEGYYITEGKAVKIIWKKNSRENKTIYTLEDGSDLVVNDGNTFIQIVPKSGLVEVK